MHWTSWYHCMKDTLAFLGVASPLKVLMQGIFILSPAMSVLRRWLISAAGWGAYWLLWELTICPYLSLWGSTPLSLGTPSPLPPEALRFPWGNPTWGATPPSGPFQFGEPPMLQTTCCHPGPKHLRPVMSGIWTFEPPLAPLLSWAHRGEAGCQLPYPGYVFGHWTNDGPLQQCILLPAYPSEVGCRVWQVHPTRLWLHLDGALQPSCCIHA